MQHPARRAATVFAWQIRSGPSTARQRSFQLVVSGNPCNFFNQIFFNRSVNAPGGRNGTKRIFFNIRFNLKPKRAQNPFSFAKLNLQSS